MAYPMYTEPPARKTPPTAVRVSSYLLYLTAVLGVITAVIALSQIGAMTDVYRQVYAGTAAQGTEAAVVAGTVVSAAIGLLFAAGLVILAAFNNRGRQGARITTWVIGGISLCRSAFGAAGTAITSSMNFNPGGNAGPSPAEVERRLRDALPSWYTPVTVTLSVVSALAVLAAIILLALPASNAYFRKAAPIFDPSLPYPPYGGQPPYGGPNPPAGPWNPPPDHGPERPPNDPPART